MNYKKASEFNPQNPQPGIYIEVPTDKYFACETATTKEGIKYNIPSKSLLSAFYKNPAEWKSGENPFIRTKNVTHGSALDSFLLTPKEFKRDYLILPENTPTKPTAAMLAAKNPSPASRSRIDFWKEMEIRAKGKEILTFKDFQMIKRGAKAVREHSEGEEILSSSHKQVVVISEYKGYLVKGMFDLLPDNKSYYGGAIIDLKRTTGFGYVEFSRIAKGLRYHWQAGLYLWMLNKQTKENRKEFFFFLSSATPPYSAGLAKLDERDIKKGKEEALSTLDFYINCVETNNWPTPWETPEEQHKTFTVNYYEKEN